MFAPQYQRYHDLMKIFSKNNEFEYGRDVKALTVGKQKHMMDYFDQHENKTMYVIMFCHEHWSETLQYSTVGISKDMYNFSASMEERMGQEIKEFDW
jgi:hypothetical protein